jgi:tRNA(Ile)-lysidine synthase
MDAALTASVAGFFGDDVPERLGVAVSGGGDSVALLAVLVDYARARPVHLSVVTVDHGIRAGARDEIALVADLCARWGLPHHVAQWSAPRAAGNFQATAREARYGLIAEWALANDIGQIALGHTADDQAETVLMRLARGAGVDGLSAMAPRRDSRGVTWLRPFLEVGRAALRACLTQAGIGWCEDPSNDNRAYARIRMRDALAGLADVGITAERLGQVASNMTQARSALDQQTYLAARAIVTFRHGALGLDKRAFDAQPAEIRRRLLVRSVMWISGSAYAPRRATVAGALSAVHSGQTTTLDGCQIATAGDTVWIFREYKSVRDVACALSECWDGRWLVTGPQDGAGAGDGPDDPLRAAGSQDDGQRLAGSNSAPDAPDAPKAPDARDALNTLDALDAPSTPDFELRALGFAAVSALQEWREIGLPRAALAVTPGVWYGAELIAAPAVRPDAAWSAEPAVGADAFFAALLSH